MSSMLVIFNPNANHAGARRSRAHIQQAMTAAGLDPTVVETEGAGHATELARRAREDGVEMIVAAGGDGTVNEVVNGLAQAADAAAGAPGGAPEGEVAGTLGILPIGSANDFAAALGQPMKLSPVVQMLAQGRTRRIDLGRVTLTAGGDSVERYFANNVGFGLEASVTVESTKIGWLNGVLLYGLAALRALAKYEPAPARVTWRTESGTEEHFDDETLLISVGNSPRVGGGFYLTPHAQMDDGLLDIGIARGISRWRTLGLLPKALNGSHLSDPAFSIVRSRCVHIACDAGQPVHADGEVLSEQAQRLSIELQPQRLQVVCAG